MCFHHVHKNGHIGVPTMCFLSKVTVVSGFFFIINHVQPFIMFIPWYLTIRFELISLLKAAQRHMIDYYHFNLKIVVSSCSHAIISYLLMIYLYMLYIHVLWSKNKCKLQEINLSLIILCWMWNYCTAALNSGQFIVTIFKAK